MQIKLSLIAFSKNEDHVNHGRYKTAVYLSGMLLMLSEKLYEYNDAVSVTKPIDLQIIEITNFKIAMTKN